MSCGESLFDGVVLKNHFRSEVIDFAVALEDKLREHDEDKGDSYKHCSFITIEQKYREEHAELEEILYLPPKMAMQMNRTDEVVCEILDLTCALMMLRWRYLNPSGTGDHEG